MDKLIERAKRLAEEWYGCCPGKRRWLEAEPPNSYGDPSHRVRLFVLEGSPPKGYILADYSNKVAKVFGVALLRKHSLRLKPIDFPVVRELEGVTYCHQCALFTPDETGKRSGFCVQIGRKIVSWRRSCVHFKKEVRNGIL